MIVSETDMTLLCLEQDGVEMTLLGRKIKASDLFVAALENEGVEYIFALPGEALMVAWLCTHICP